MSKEQKMPYVTPMERRAEKRGEKRGRLKSARESILDILEIRFGKAPEDLAEVVGKLEDLELLRCLQHKAVTADSPDALRRELDGYVIARE